MAEKKVYKNPDSGKPLLSTISSGCKTPPLEVKFSNLVRPFYYPNSPTIPRYSVTCIIDPIIHKEFLKGIQSIEKNESVETIIKNEIIKDKEVHVTTGKVLMKFQNKERVPIYLKSGDEVESVELEDEFAKGENIIVEFDVIRYTKKNTMKTEHGLSFKTVAIHLQKKGN